MGLRINTNTRSLTALRHLYNTSIRMGKSMEKVSSGLRINRAADDAAGLAISENLKQSIHALDQTARNAADGISLVQVGEGAMEEISNILIRMRELAQQAATETLGSAERAYLNNEFVDLRTEIDRIVDTTMFNSITLLDGSQGPISIQVHFGSVAGTQVEIDLSTDVNTATLGIDGDVLTGPDGTNALAAIANVEAANEVISSRRSYFGGLQNRMESAIRNIKNSAENLSAANSRIRDLDLASEISLLTTTQILSQSGISVLSQANASTNMALQVLQRQ